MKLIGVSGRPGVGKTTVARFIHRVMPKSVVVNFQAPVWMSDLDPNPMHLHGDELIHRRLEGASLLCINHSVVIFDNVRTVNEANAILGEGGLIISVVAAMRGTHLPVLGNEAAAIDKLAMATIHNDGTEHVLGLMVADLVHSQGIFERLVAREAAKRAMGVVQSEG